MNNIQVSEFKEEMESVLAAQYSPERINLKINREVDVPTDEIKIITIVN